MLDIKKNTRKKKQNNIIVQFIKQEKGGECVSEVNRRCLELGPTTKEKIKKLERRKGCHVGVLRTKFPKMPSFKMCCDIVILLLNEITKPSNNGSGTRLGMVEYVVFLKGKAMFILVVRVSPLDYEAQAHHHFLSLPTP